MCDDCWPRLTAARARAKIGVHLAKEEMPMERADRRGSKKSRWLQQSLFHAASPRPTWESLPPEVRSSVTELLGRIWGKARERNALALVDVAAAAGAEDVDE